MSMKKDEKQTIEFKKSIKFYIDQAEEYYEARVDLSFWKGFIIATVISWLINLIWRTIFFLVG